MKRADSNLRSRLLLTLAVLLELVFFFSAAAIFILGGIPDDPAILAWAAGAVVGLSVLTTFGLPAGLVSRGSVHGALLAGSLLFALPFVWLVGTSFKYPEETFASPPVWIPEVPASATTSPRIRPPRGLDPAPVEWASAVWEAARPHIPSSELASVDADLARHAVTARLWDILAASHETVSATEIEQEVNPERIEDVWSQSYRSVGLGAVTVYDVDLLAQGLEPGEVQWSVDGGTFIMHETEPQLRYTFGTGDGRSDVGEGTVRVNGMLNLPFPSEQLLQVMVSMRQDRSWHRLRAILDANGTRYETRDALYLGEDGFRELGFVIRRLDDRDLRDIGIFPLYAVDGVAATDLHGDTARLSLLIERSSRLEAVWAKYTQTYRDVWFAESNWPRYFWNSLVLVVLTVIGQMLSCSMVAFAFARLRWPGRDVLFVVLLSTMMLPAQVTMVPVFLIYKHLGWYNTLLPLWVPAFLGTPFFVFLLRQFMKTIPRELEEAARIDGCSWFGIYRCIMLPLMKPGLAAVGIFTFMWTWNEFMAPLIYLSDARHYPLAMGLFTFRTEHDTEFGMLMAASTLMTVPVIALFFLTQRYFVEGVTLTGLKG